MAEGRLLDTDTAPPAVLRVVPAAHRKYASAHLCVHIERINAWGMPNGIKKSD